MISHTLPQSLSNHILPLCNQVSVSISTQTNLRDLKLILLWPPNHIPATAGETLSLNNSSEMIQSNNGTMMRKSNRFITPLTQTFGLRTTADSWAPIHGMITIINIGITMAQSLNSSTIRVITTWHLKFKTTIMLKQTQLIAITKIKNGTSNTATKTSERSVDKVTK
jgi:hypothetical protein